MSTLHEQIDPKSGFVRGADLSVDPEFVAHLKSLSKLQVWRGAATIAVDWAVIVGCFALALTYPHPLTWIAAAVIVASRQHALLIIMHDAAHYRLLASRNWNDRLSNWFLAWPVLVSTEGYRDNHLAHHFHLNTDEDPDWVRKEGKHEWEFPKTRIQFARLLLRDFLGGGFLDMLRAIGDLSVKRARTATSGARRLERLAYYLSITAVAVGSGIWLPVLVLWFLPAFTILPVILRIRSIAEHFGVEGEHDLNMSRNFEGPLWERLLLAPHNVGYHLDHHLYPSVPFYNLKQLHRLLLLNRDYCDNAHQNASLTGLRGPSVLNDVVSQHASPVA